MMSRLVLVMLHHALSELKIDTPFGKISIKSLRVITLNKLHVKRQRLFSNTHYTRSSSFKLEISSSTNKAGLQ
jgi:hypothetical protein